MSDLVNNVKKYLSDFDLKIIKKEVSASCAYAASIDNINMLEFFRGKNPNNTVIDWDAFSCTLAAQYGHLDTLKWLRDPTTGGGVCPWEDDLSCYNTEPHNEYIRKTGLEQLRYQDGNTIFYQAMDDVIAGAAKNGHIDIIEWLRDPNTGGGVCPWNTLACEEAIKNGQLETVKWLRNPETGGGVCPLDEDSYLKFVENGDMEMFEWLYYNIYDDLYDDDTSVYLEKYYLRQAIEDAAFYDHLHIIKWLRDPNTGFGVTPWTATLCEYAAKRCNREMLAWLRDPTTGGGACPWTDDNRRDLLESKYISSKVKELVIEFSDSKIGDFKSSDFKLIKFPLPYINPFHNTGYFESSGSENRDFICNMKNRDFIRNMKNREFVRNSENPAKRRRLK